MIRYFILVFFLLKCSIGDAQVKKLKPWLIPEMGLQIGATEPSADLRLQGGIKRQNWYYGLGTAVDFYRFKSYPVYLQLQRVFSFRGTAPFLIASAGYNFKKASDTVPTWIGSRVYERTGGYYAELGGGFVFKIAKKERLQLSVVKNIKQVKESYDIDYWMGPGQNRSARSTDLYTMHRVAVRLGWKF